MSCLVITKKPIQMEKLETCLFKFKVGHWEQVWLQLLLKSVKRYYWQRLLLPYILYLSPYWQRRLLPFILYLLLLAKVIVTIQLVFFTFLAKVIITFHLVSCTLLAKVIITFYLVVLISQPPSLSRNQPTFPLVNITIQVVPK